MEPILLPLIALSLVFVAFQAFVVLFLAKRAVELKLGNLWFLVASGISFIVSALLGASSSPVQILSQPFGPLFVAMFTKRTFYDKARSNYAIVMPVAIVFTCLTFAARIFRLTGGDSDMLYLVNQLVLFGVFFPCYAWLAKACFDANRRFSKEMSLGTWIQKRYLLLGTSSLFTMFATIPSFFMGSMSGFYTPMGFVGILAIVANLLVFSILNYLCWVMPTWFKMRLGESRVGTFRTGSTASEQAAMPPTADKVLTGRGTVAIIDYIGNMLAARINKSPGAVKGLLLLMFQGEQDESGARPLTFSDVVHAIDHHLSQRLEQLGIKDAGAITRQFSDDVTRNQSVLLMMSV